MIQINFTNGAKYNLKGIVLQGQYVDSDGTTAPGSNPIAYTEADLNQLNAAIPLQQLFNALTVEPVDTQETSEEEQA